MALTREDDKPWKTDLARKSAQRRELVVHEVEEVIKKAASFEEALKLAAELLKKRFARFSAVSVYVADGEDLALHTSVERPAGPDRLGAGGNPLADAAHGTTVTSISNVSSSEAWTALGLTQGSVMIAPIRTEAGLWAALEIWSDFRDAFTTQDVKLTEKVTAALGKKTPAA
jgi:putative methionine-R-sulfoxide reductase with GAF domain